MERTSPHYAAHRGPSQESLPPARREAVKVAALEEMLSAIDAKLGRGLDLAAELPDLAVMKAKLRDLRDEREKVASELGRTARAPPTLDDARNRRRSDDHDVFRTRGSAFPNAPAGEPRCRVSGRGFPRHMYARGDRRGGHSCVVDPISR